MNDPVNDPTVFIGYFLQHIYRDELSIHELNIISTYMLCRYILIQKRNKYISSYVHKITYLNQKARYINIAIFLLKVG